MIVNYRVKSPLETESEVYNYSLILPYVKFNKIRKRRIQIPDKNK